MDYIKNRKGIFITLSVILLMAAMFIYNNVILTPQLETLHRLEEGNYERKSHLNMLEQELATLAHVKEENMDIGYEINALENKVPYYASPAVIAADISKYLSLYKFENAHVEVKQEIEMEAEKDYKSIPVHIRFEAKYNEAVRFVEMLNRSNQMITINYFAINNDIQDQEETELLTTEIVLLIYYREKEGEEVYSSFIDYTDKEDIFGKINSNQKEDIHLEETVIQEKTTFNLHISDIFRSGDNYSFSAYAPNEEATYVGLTSTHDTKMVITIWENSYKCLIEDTNGDKSEQQIDGKIVNPNINITSQIQKVMEDMPSVSIYIRNYTSNIININMEGTCLEHINIYNENNKLVEIGEKSGRISLQ